MFVLFVLFLLYEVLGFIFTWDPIWIEQAHVKIVCIGLAKNKSKFFDPLHKQLHNESLYVEYVEGIDGRNLKLADVQHKLSTRYVEFFKTNAQQVKEGTIKTNYMGHLACSLTHLQILQSSFGMTLILEEDACPVTHFKQKLYDVLKEMNQIKWDVLLLGFSADYKHHFHHKLNDQEPVMFGKIILSTTDVVDCRIMSANG